MKKSLNAIVNKQFLTSSLIPIFTMGLFLLVLYFGISAFITTKTMNTLLEETKQNMREIFYREAQNINQQLKEISTDVTIEKFANHILTRDFPWQASAFLVNKEGMILAMSEKVKDYLHLKEIITHADGEKLTESIKKPETFNLLKNTDEKIVRQIKKLFSDNANMIDFTVNNQAFLLFQEMIDETGWRLLFLVDTEIIFQPIFELKALSLRIGYLLIVFMILFYIVFLFYIVNKSRHLSTKISSPIAHLANLSSKMVDNMETIEIKPLDSDIKELSQLSDHFNIMLVHLKERFVHLEEARNTLEIKVQERTHELSQTVNDLKHDLKYDLKLAQQALIHSEKMAALGQLVAGIAHEINTPLAAIRSSIDNIITFLEKGLLEQLPHFCHLLSQEQPLLIGHQKWYFPSKTLRVMVISVKRCMRISLTALRLY